MLDYSTLPPLLLLPRLPLGSLRSQIFFSPTPFFSPFSPNAEPGPRLLGFRLVILQNCSKFFCYNLLASSSHSQCPPYLIYTFQGRREEVKKYRCAFPLLSKLLSFRYIFEKRHTLNSLNRHLYKADTCCWFLPFFCYFSVSILSEDTRPLKRTTDAFETVNGHLRSVLLSENTSKIHQTVYGKLPFLLFCRLIRPIRRHCTVTLLDL